MLNQPGTVKTQLNAPLQYLKGVGPALAKKLAKLDLFTMEDLLFYFPRSYEDRRKIPRIIDLKPGEIQFCVGQILHCEETQAKGMSLLKCVITDGSAHITAVWFNQSFLKTSLRGGQQLFVKGKVDYNAYNHTRQILVSDTEILSSPQALKEAIGRIMPVYALTIGIYQSKLRQCIKEVLSTHLPLIKEPLPKAYRDELGLIPLQEALQTLHFPSTLEAYEKARTRVTFDEFFFFQCELAKRRLFLKTPQLAAPLQTQGPFFEAYLSALPYKLTQAQQRCIQEIHEDLNSFSVMNRLLQGDVGAGKTDVAMMTLLCAVQSGKKGAIMAPTQILAEQHYLKFKTYLDPLGIPVFLVKGKMKAKEKREALETLQSDTPMIVVGTHALIEDKVMITDLGVAVIDEQHRFGVMQRMTLKNKAPNTHCLFMTATPIPRTYMLTSFGDLEKSIIDEMPPGRTPQKTYFAKEASLSKIYNHCRLSLQAGRQLYVVYPLVSESEKIDLKSAEEGYLHLKNVVFPEFEVGLLHGQLSTSEKSSSMQAFKEGRIQILVATTVIEVGVDVPNASMMIIQHAERFGLSQLHQLRGRIGRGGTASECYLVGDPKTPTGKQRIKAMTQTTDGFKIAEYDLQIRGPGDMLGTKQAGLPSFKLADLIQDEKQLLAARKFAFKLISADPDLTHSDHRLIKEHLHRQGELFEGKQLN